MFDAAANRAAEGLRVVEDYVRFVLDDVHLTRCFKELRHDLAGAVQQAPPSLRWAARDTRHDIGPDASDVVEASRADLSAVVVANLQRAEQALRTLEEVARLESFSWAGQLEALRYRAYSLEAALGMTLASVERLQHVRLYVLLEAGDPGQCERLAESLLRAGVDAIQLREKQLDDRTVLDCARRLRQLTRKHGALLIVNDRADLAAATDADGVHVGQEDLTVRDVRRVLGPAALVGVSTQSLEQARQAVLDGANYLGVGPIFPSTTKHFEHFPGVDLLRAVAGEIRLPAFAIGGITVDRLSAVMEAGFGRVAVGAAITGAKNPGGAARQFVETLEKSPVQVEE